MTDRAEADDDRRRGNGRQRAANEMRTRTVKAALAAAEAAALAAEAAAAMAAKSCTGTQSGLRPGEKGDIKSVPTYYVLFYGKPPLPLLSMVY